MKRNQTTRSSLNILNGMVANLLKQEISIMSATSGVIYSFLEEIDMLIFVFIY